MLVQLWDGAVGEGRKKARAIGTTGCLGHLGRGEQCVMRDFLRKFRSRERCVKRDISRRISWSRKTSLVNYLLKMKDSKRIAVIENEFGEVNIDRELVSDNLIEEEDLVCIENGCMCCSMRKDIVKALSTIEKRSTSRGTKVDAIFLETSGLADPSPVAYTFFTNPWVASRFKLDSVICVVDALHLMEHLQDLKPDGAINEAVQQLAFSDIILLNKVDLVTEAVKAEVIAAILCINSSASIVECQLNDPSRCPSVDSLINIGSFSVNRALEVDSDFFSKDSDLSDDDLEVSTESSRRNTSRAPVSRESAAHQHGADCDVDISTRSCCGLAADGMAHVHAAGCLHQYTEAGCSPMAGGTKRKSAEISVRLTASFVSPDVEGGEGQVSLDGNVDFLMGGTSLKKKKKMLHDLSGISSVGIQVVGTLDESRFNMFMRDLLMEKAKDIYRCKGVLAVQGYGDQKFIFQGVHETICYGPANKPWQEGEEKVNKIVFIGKGLNRKALIKGFQTCLHSVSQSGGNSAIGPSSEARQIQSTI
eukprot:gene609-2037_t